MAGMPLTAILTCAAAFLVGLAVSMTIYIARHRRRTAKTPAMATWPGDTPPRVHYATGPDSTIVTPDKIASGAITPADIAAGDPRNDR